MGSRLIMWRNRFLASSKRVRVGVSLILTVFVYAVGASIYGHFDEQRRNERAIYFVAWAAGLDEGLQYPYSISIDRRFDSEGANRNARDKTGAQRCIPVKYLADFNNKQSVVRAYVCGNGEMTDNLQFYGSSDHATRYQNRKIDASKTDDGDSASSDE